MSIFVTMLVSKRNPQFRFWPPPRVNSWQYHSLWWAIRILVVCIGWLIWTEHSTLEIPDWVRIFFALPTFVLFFVLGSVAAHQLGWRNTHGEAVEFVDSGLYGFSRNPQYVFYSISFVSLAILVASFKAFVLLLLLSVWYLRAPIPEEKWLEIQYGQKYLAYKKKVPRYWYFSQNK